MFLSGTDILILLLLLFGAGENSESSTNRLDDTCTMTELALPNRLDALAILVNCDSSIGANDAVAMASNYLMVVGKSSYQTVITLVGPDQGKLESKSWVVGLEK